MKLMYPSLSRFHCILLIICLFYLFANTSLARTQDGEKIKALIVTGQCNPFHNWEASSPILKQLLEETGLFEVDMSVSPASGENMDAFQPDFAAYDVVVLDYEGDSWPDQTKKAFVDYVSSGGGVVSFHASDNAFPEWPEFNEIIGLGGWGGRNEQWGPMVRFRDGEVVLDNSPGRAGSHPRAHQFEVVNRNREHPITSDLPEKWLSAPDELYSQLRGPAKNLTVLATAYADPSLGGTGENEPVLFTITYGQGRVFHTIFGHVGPRDTPPFPALEGISFIVTFQRGTEWAATGEVTQVVPKNFPR